MMPRKKEQTQLPKASYTGEQARFRRLGVNIDESPSFGSSPIPIADLPLWVASYHWYRDGERLLDREEVWGMAEIDYGEKHRFNERMFKKFDNPNSPVVIAVKALRGKYEQVLCGEAEEKGFG